MVFEPLFLKKSEPSKGALNLTGRGFLFQWKLPHQRINFHSFIQAYCQMMVPLFSIPNPWFLKSVASWGATLFPSPCCLDPSVPSVLPLIQMAHCLSLHDCCPTQGDFNKTEDDPSNTVTASPLTIFTWATQTTAVPRHPDTTSNSSSPRISAPLPLLPTFLAYFYLVTLPPALLQLCHSSFSWPILLPCFSLPHTVHYLYLFCLWTPFAPLSLCGTYLAKCQPKLNQPSTMTVPKYVSTQTAECCWRKTLNCAAWFHFTCGTMNLK